MTLFIIILVLVSATMHAGWNLISYRRKSVSEFFNRMGIVIIVVGFAPAVATEFFVRCLSPQIIVYVTISGMFAGVYYYYLVCSYEETDFSLAYPLIRALPILLIALGDTILGRLPTPAGWAGMGLVTMGCMLVSFNPAGKFSIKKYLSRTNFWIIFAVLGVVGYTLTDKTASDVIEKGAMSAMLYDYVFFATTYLFYFLFIKIAQKKCEGNSDAGWMLPGVGAVLNFGAYWLILWAFQTAKNASYIFAFRQVSILIGVAIALGAYRESNKILRLAGAVTITAGLILISVWGK